jgi:hypothetical protein
MTEPPQAQSSSPDKPPRPAASAVPARGGRQVGHSRNQSSPAPPTPIVRDKTGRPLNLSKDLKPGQRLNRGDSLFSALGAFRLTLQTDGDLVLYTIVEEQLPDDVRAVLAHTPEVMKLYTTRIWSVGTSVANERAGQGSYCVMNDDGNFVIYDADGRTCFESGTHGHPGSYLRCQDDGNLVIYTPDSNAIWSSGTHSRSGDVLEPVAVKPKRTLNLTKDLKPGQRLDRGDSLFSALGAFRLTLETDGDLVLYTIVEEQLPDDVRAVLAHAPEVMKLYTTRIWSVGTSVGNERAGQGSYCVMHDDGNFAVYDSDGRICFESETHGHPGSYLRCQDDGNLVIYTPDSNPIWRSGTHSRPPDDLDHARFRVFPHRVLPPQPISVPRTP